MHYQLVTRRKNRSFNDLHCELCNKINNESKSIFTTLNSQLATIAIVTEPMKHKHGLRHTTWIRYTINSPLKKLIHSIIYIANYVANPITNRNQLNDIDNDDITTTETRIGNETWIWKSRKKLMNEREDDRKQIELRKRKTFIVAIIVFLHEWLSHHGS